ncbi:hypothetical protein CMO91_02905 [Candidatus Woesearchaeota archaeon]|nr:hypothetical protein [Candidatus Woesearchaeota archaeon]|tara:strand:+ start:1696 stop:2037 length:342 start_codon:yes stop_codon:yes gene_type:complete
MAQVVITRSLENVINKVFKKQSVGMLQFLRTLEEQPKKGKFVGNVGAVAIKELKHRGHRFYFVTDGFKIKFLEVEELRDLLITFVAMSDKKDQQKTIDEIKDVLSRLGSSGFA